jgi:hypothetical protein
MLPKLWRIKYNAPDQFATLHHGVQDYARKVWGPGYGTGAPLIDTQARLDAHKGAEADRKRMER